MVVLGLMLHAPGAGQQAEEFVRWATAGTEAGLIDPETIKALKKNFANHGDIPGPAPAHNHKPNPHPALFDGTP